MCLLGLWEETRLAGEKPHAHKKNMKTLTSKAPDWKDDPATFSLNNRAACMLGHLVTLKLPPGASK